MSVTKVLFGSSFTFGFLRPETTRLGSRQAIITDMNKLGFPIVAMDEVLLNPKTIEKVYSQWWGEPKRDQNLVDYLTSGKVLAFVVRDVLSYIKIDQEGKILTSRYSFSGPERLRWVCGSVAEKTMGAGLRGKYGISALETAIHRSDSEQDALYELTLIAPHLIREILSSNFRRSRLEISVVEQNLDILGIPEGQFSESEFWNTIEYTMQLFLLRNNYYN